MVYRGWKYVVVSSCRIILLIMITINVVVVIGGGDMVMTMKPIVS